MESKVLNWFLTTFHNDYDEDGEHRVMSNDRCFVKDLTEELIEVRKKDIMNILKILNDNFPISDGGSCWLENEKDFELVTNQIIEFEKIYYYGKED